MESRVFEAEHAFHCTLGDIAQVACMFVQVVLHLISGQRHA